MGAEPSSLLVKLAPNLSLIESMPVKWLVVPWTQPTRFLGLDPQGKKNCRQAYFGIRSDF